MAGPKRNPTTRPTSSTTSRSTTKPKSQAKQKAQPKLDGFRHLDKKKKKFNEKVNELDTKHRGEIIDLRKKFKRNETKGYNKIRRYLSQQIHKLDSAKEKALRRGKEISLQTGSLSKQIDQQLEKTIKQYKETIHNVTQPLIQLSISILNGKSYFDAKQTAEFMRLHKIYHEQFANKLNKNKDLQKKVLDLMQQLRKGKKLTKKQMAQLMEFVDSKEISKMNNIETTQIGFLLNLMTPEQKTQLIRGIIESPKNSKSAVKIIDSLTKMAVIGVHQGHVLMKEALNKDQNRQQMTVAAREAILKKFTDGTYNLQQNQILSQRNKIVRELQQRFYKNPALRYLNSSSILGMFGFIWGILTTSLNLIVNRGKMNKESLWGVAAIFGSAAVLQKGRQTDKRGTFGLNSPYTEFTKGVLFKENRQTLKDLRNKQNVQTFADVLNNYPLHKYMATGGFETLINERQAIKGRKEKIKSAKFKSKVHAQPLTYERLVKIETDKKSGKAALLKRAIQLVPGFNHQERIRYFNNLLHRLGTAADQTGKKTTKEFKSGIAYVRDRYGLTKKK